MRKFVYVRKLKSRIACSKYILTGLTLVLPTCVSLFMSAPTASASATFNTYSTTSTYSQPNQVTTAGGSLWYAEINSSGNNDIIGNMTTSGTVVADYNVSQPTGATSFSIMGLTTGPDGNIWFDGCSNNNTGYIYTGVLNVSTGAVTFTRNTLVSCFNGGVPGPITAGPDGYLWYVDDYYNYSGYHEYLFSLNPSTGATTNAYSFSYQSINSLTAGSDGRLWVTIPSSNEVEAFNVSAGAMTGSSTYTIPTSSSEPGGIKPGPDGAMWFMEYGTSPRTIAKVTTSGSFTEYPQASGVSPTGLNAGPDGAMWFTDTNGGKVGRISTAGSVVEYTIPGTNMLARGIILGPDGAMWFPYTSGTSPSYTYGLGRLSY